MKMYNPFIEIENGIFASKDIVGKDNVLLTGRKKVFHVDGLYDSLGINPIITFIIEDTRSISAHKPPYIRKEDRGNGVDELLQKIDYENCQKSFLCFMSNSIINPLLRRYGMRLYPCLRETDWELSHEVFGLIPGVGRDLTAAFIDPVHNTPHVGFFIKGMGYVSLNLEKAAYILSGDNSIAKQIIWRALSNIPNINRNLIWKWCFDEVGDDTHTAFRLITEEKIEEKYFNKTWKETKYSWDRIMSHTNEPVDFALQIVKEKAKFHRAGRRINANICWHGREKEFNEGGFCNYEKQKRGTAYSKFRHEHAGQYHTDKEYSEAYQKQKKEGLL